jgi:hypothetical protein
VERIIAAIACYTSTDLTVPNIFIVDEYLIISGHTCSVCVACPGIPNGYVNYELLKITHSLSACVSKFEKHDKTDYKKIAKSILDALRGKSVEFHSRGERDTLLRYAGYAAKNFHSGDLLQYVKLTN